MVGTRSTIKGLDTGQLSNLNKLDISSKQKTVLELLKSTKNQANNSKISEATNDGEEESMEEQWNEQDEEPSEREQDRTVRFNDEIMTEEVNQNHSTQMINKKGLSIEVVMEKDSSEKSCSITIVHAVEQLLMKWTEMEAIQGVYGKKNELIKEDYEDVEGWAIAPKIVKKPKLVLVEMIIDVETMESAYKLYQAQKEYCDKHKIRVSARNTIMEYTKRVGFLTGPSVKISSPKRYIEELEQYLQIEQGTIDVKKKYTYDKGHRSKVLVINAIESKAKEVNEMLCLMKSPRFKYISYKKTTPQERLQAMYHNDKNNENGRYEILENVHINDEVKMDINGEFQKLEQVIMTVKKGGNFLFLAAEQGDGKFENRVIVVLNPKTQQQAKRWIVDEYMEMIFKQQRELKTSVDPNQFKINNAYSESLKDFLKPKIDEVEIAKSKYGKKLKSYADVTRLNKKTQQEKETVKKQEKKNKKDQRQQENKEVNQDLTEVVKGLKGQIEKLTDLIGFLLKEIVLEENSKQEIEKKLQMINQKDSAQEVNDAEEIEITQNDQQEIPRKHRERSEGTNVNAGNDTKRIKVNGHASIIMGETGSVRKKVAWYNNIHKDAKKDKGEGNQIQ